MEIVTNAVEIVLLTIVNCPDLVLVEERKKEEAAVRHTRSTSCSTEKLNCASRPSLQLSSRQSHHSNCLGKTRKELCSRS